MPDDVISPAEARLQEKKRIRQKSLEFVHTDRCRILPNRELMLNVLPTGGIVAEVGVAFGDFSEQIIKRTAPRVLHLIDAWGVDRYSSGLKQVQDKFAAKIEDGSVVVNQGYSIPTLEQYPDATFDWIYIDTNHSFDTTLGELKVGSRKVKPGGYLSGHDFCTGNVIAPVVYGVVEACVSFCQTDGWTFKYVTLEPSGHWSFCLEQI